MAPAQEVKQEEETAVTDKFKSFMESARTIQFVGKWHEEGYTKAGISEILYELHARYGDSDMDMVYERGDEILSVLKRVDLRKFKLKSEGPPEGPAGEGEGGEEGGEPPEGGGKRKVKA